MKVTYKSKKLEKRCTIARETIKVYGVNKAELIHQRIDQIKAADTVEHLVQYHIGRCHPLHDENNQRRTRRNQYAMDLGHPYRLVFEKIEEEIQIAEIQSIEDYHQLVWKRRNKHD